LTPVSLSADVAWPFGMFVVWIFGGHLRKSERIFRDVGWVVVSAVALTAITMRKQRSQFLDAAG
jgi:hypothetical protein